MSRLTAYRLAMPDTDRKEEGIRSAAQSTRCDTPQAIRAPHSAESCYRDTPHFFPFFFFFPAPLFPVSVVVVVVAGASPSTFTPSLSAVSTPADAAAVGVGTALARGEAMDVSKRRLSASNRLRMMLLYVLYFRHCFRTEH